MSTELVDYNNVIFSVAMTDELNQALVGHVDKGRCQEDLTFAYWHPSRGRDRITAVLYALNLPKDGEHILEGNVSFTSDYLVRVLDECPAGSGIALVHSHVGPGWQGMSHDDVVAERDRLAGCVAGRTSLPIVGLTWGTDGTWSARCWLRVARRQYERRDAATVRSVGRRLHTSYHPRLMPAQAGTASQVATMSVWGEPAQQDLARLRVGIVGLGSVGSIVAEALARTGVQHVTMIDADRLEPRNLDRTLGAEIADLGSYKVDISARQAHRAATASSFQVVVVPKRIQDPEGYAAAVACDVLVCCVDRPWPRHILNVIANAHLIPVIDGGILARFDARGRLAHVGWRIHTVGPGRACLYCLDAVRRSEVQLDRDGKLDDPDYFKGLSNDERERYAGRNVFAFSMSVAAHEVLQLVGLVSGNARVGGKGPQTYHAYPGSMETEDTRPCHEECDLCTVTALACDPIN